MSEKYSLKTADSIALSAIDFYKRNLSGKLIFRNIRCTFEGDTCSSYGKRIVESHGIIKGIGLISRRTKRCSDYKLFAYDDQTLGWGDGFQRIISDRSRENLDAILDKLHSADESPACIGHILKGAQTVHRYVFNQPSEDIAALIEKEKVQDYKAKLRNAKGYQKYFKMRLAKSALPIIGAELLTFIQGVPDELIHVGVGLYGLKIVYNYLKDMRFYSYFDRLGEVKRQSL